MPITKEELAAIAKPLSRNIKEYVELKVLKRIEALETKFDGVIGKVTKAYVETAVMTRVEALESTIGSRHEVLARVKVLETTIDGQHHRVLTHLSEQIRELRLQLNNQAGQLSSYRQRCEQLEQKAKRCEQLDKEIGV